MGIFKHKPPAMSEMQQAIANGCAQAAAGQQSSDVQQQRELMENAWILNDKTLTQMLLGMSKYSYKDNDGLLGEKGKVYEGAIPKYVALSIINSNLIRTGFIDEKQARIMLWEAHRLFLTLESQLTEEEYEDGGASVLDSNFMVVKSNILGSVNGRISKLVKSRPHSVDVTVGTQSQERKP